MIKIRLDSLSIENFRSYRNRTVIEFSDRGGLFGLVGKNLAEPRLGSNGAGKSTVFEALAWCLDGRTTSGDRAADVVSWGAEQPEVEAAFWIDGILFAINRRGSPNRLTINGDIAEQIDVDRLIGLDRARFQQAVLFGQFAPLFLELSIQQRGELLDEMLALEYWLKLSDFADSEADAYEKEANDVGKQIAKLQGQITELSDEKSLSEQSARWVAEHRERLSEAIQEVADKENEEAALRQELDAARKTPVLAAAERGDELSDIRESIGHTRASLAVIQVRIDTIAEQVDFYREHSTCPTCRQTIGDEFIREIRSELMNESARLKSDAAVKQADIDQKSLWLKKHEPEIRDAWIAARERDRKIAAQVERLNRIEDDIERACARAERIGNERNPFDEQLRLARSRREELTKQQRALNRQMLSLKAKAEKANYWKTAFKRVRLFIVRRIMQSLEMEVAAAASALGLPGWRISFATETETKSGSIKHGIQIAVQSPQTTGPWSKWSGGEGQRIKLSVNIGLSNLIQKMAGVDIAFEVWDEPSQHLSVEGVEDLLTCLEYRAQVTGKQIWVVDHTPINYAGFTEVWQATKTSQDGSRLERIAGV